MNNNTMSNEEEVLLAFAVEPNQDQNTLDRYLRDYPEYAIALVECSVELMADAVRSLNEIESTAGAVDSAWQRFQSVMKMTEDNPLTNPFAKLKSADFKSLAKRLEITTLMLIRLRDRAIKPITIPKSFNQRLATELGTTAESLLAFLNGPPIMTSNLNFRSAVESVIQDQISFQQAIETSQLTEIQKNMLKALKD